MKITVKIKRLDKTVPLPEYKTHGAVAFDLAVLEEKTIMPGETVIFKTGLVVQVPEGYMLMLAPRSSNAKKEIRIANGIGVIDQDYCGPEDELYLALHNFGKSPYTTKKYERLAQAMIVPIANAEFEEVDNLEATNRGGYGTTG